MDDDSDLRALPLNYLPYRTQTILSCLLNPPKVIPSPGPEKLPRDWRGLANLTNITSEVESYIKEQKDQTAEVLKIWMRDDTAMVGQLLDYLQQMDRFDVYDDICQDLRVTLEKGELGNSKVSTATVPLSTNEPLTYDDTPWERVFYDAFLLYALEDRDFAYTLQERCENEGLKICTVDKLQCGYSTKYAPITELISNRCKRIILLLSPEFLQSPANAFFADYAQALSIESRKRRLIPIMYRNCDLPENLKFIHPLYFNTQENAIFNFWKKLMHSLDATPGIQNGIRMNGTASRISRGDQDEDLANRLFLNPPPLNYTYSNSTGALDSLQVPSRDIGDSKSLTSIGQISTSSGKKKKLSAIKDFFRIGNKKKQKEKFTYAG